MRQGDLRVLIMWQPGGIVGVMGIGTGMGLVGEDRGRNWITMGFRGVLEIEAIG